jgi:GNAT superfamily N-acetyltransferase
MNSDISYRIASTDFDFELGRSLFKEYAASLGVDLSFQDFETELKVMHLQYNKPSGALLLAVKGGLAVGCAGIRKIDDETAELKRMYVQDAWRERGIGVNLLEFLIAHAKGLGYKKIRLDTLSNMTKAQSLYRSAGFYPIPSYRFNPLEGTVYMEKVL